MIDAARPRAEKGRAGGRSAADRAVIAPLDVSAFPFEEPPDAVVTPDGTRFFDRDADGSLFHMAPRGGRLPEATYRDPRSLLFVPRGFRPGEPAALVLFLHGNLATLSRDVARRQRVPAQVEASRANVLLVAPQMATNALDSSAGNFWKPGFLDRYLAAAGARLATMPGVGLDAGALASLPVVIVAYSGGYLPTAFSLDYARQQGQSRIAGVILLDALFGEEARFAAWITAEHARTFFVSVFSKASADLDAKLERDIAPVPVEHELPARLGPGVVALVAVPNAVHDDFVTAAYRRDPLADLLARIDPASLAGAGAPR